MNTNSLKLNWFNLLHELKVDRHVGEAIFTDLVNAHCQPTRHYHNLSHIQHLLTLIKEVQAIADRPSVIQFAAWFHDYVYNPQAKDNEVQSAVCAREAIEQLNVNPDIIKSVKQIILSTQKHQPLIDSIDNLIFLDVDLAILGTSAKQYFQYANAIRQEYIWLSDRDYRQGRIQVLNNFLAREKIYYTDYFYQKLELSARENLKAEIEYRQG